MKLNINAELNSEQQAFVETAKQFANDNIINKANDWDKNEFFPVNIFKDAAKLGFGGIYVPQEDGGTFGFECGGV